MADVDGLYRIISDPFETINDILFEINFYVNETYYKNVFTYSARANRNGLYKTFPLNPVLVLSMFVYHPIKYERLYYFYTDCFH